MSNTIHKQLVRRFYDEVWNRHDLTRLGEILEPGFSFRGSLGPELTGHAAFAAYVDQVHASLADYRCDIVELVGEGEKVVARMRFHGLHRGPLLGLAPTGRHVEWAGSAHFTFGRRKNCRSVGARRHLRTGEAALVGAGITAVWPGSVVSNAPARSRRNRVGSLGLGTTIIGFDASSRKRRN